MLMPTELNPIEITREKLSDRGKTHRRRQEDLKFSRSLSIEQRWSLFDKWEKVLGGKKSSGLDRIKLAGEREQYRYKKEFFESKLRIQNTLKNIPIAETVCQYEDRGGIITKIPPLLIEVIELYTNHKNITTETPPSFIKSIALLKKRGGLPRHFEDAIKKESTQKAIRKGLYTNHNVLWSYASMYSIDETKQLDLEYEFIGKRVKPYKQTDDLADNQNSHDDIAARDFRRVLIGKWR